MFQDGNIVGCNIVFPSYMYLCVCMCVCFLYLCKMLYCMSAANKDSDSDY